MTRKATEKMPTTPIMVPMTMLLNLPVTRFFFNNASRTSS